MGIKAEQRIKGYGTYMSNPKMNTNVSIVYNFFFPFCLQTNISLCSSWFLTKADLAFNQKLFRKAIQNYLTAIFVATNYLRNDTNNPEQNAMDNVVLRRMISCCMALDSYTQVINVNINMSIVI